MILETDQEEFSQDAHLCTSRACDASNVVKFIFSKVTLEATLSSGNKNRVYVVCEVTRRRLFLFRGEAAWNVKSTSLHEQHMRGRAYSFLLTKILRNFVSMQQIGCKTMSARSGRLRSANRLSCSSCQMN